MSISVATDEPDRYASYVDFIKQQTCPEAVLADYLESERLGAELLNELALGWTPSYEIVPPPGRFHTFVIGKWAVKDGQIVTWLEQVTERESV